jgi:hypothetical protein
MPDHSLMLQQGSGLSNVVITRDRLIAVFEAATNGNHNERIYVRQAKGVRLEDLRPAVIAVASAGYKIVIVLESDTTCKSILAEHDVHSAGSLKFDETLRHYCEEHPTNTFGDASIERRRASADPNSALASSPANVDSARGTPDSQTGAVAQGDDASLVALLQRQLYGCWSPPVGLLEAKNLVVRVTFSLNRDGFLSGAPQVKTAGSGPLFQAAAESAVRAIRKCTPVKLPADKYESWKELEITFDPHMMQ